VDDYREILRHASNLHIEVLPEVDMPGHAHAAVQSMRVRHAALMSSADGKTHTDFLLSDPDDKSVYKAVNDHQDTVINPCMESSYAFVEHVLSALKDMHKVSKLFLTISIMSSSVYTIPLKIGSNIPLTSRPSPPPSQFAI